jgi:hypothetical protein
VGAVPMKNAYHFGMAPVLTFSYRSGSPQTAGYYISSNTPPPMSRFGLFHRKEFTHGWSSAICLSTT